MIDLHCHILPGVDDGAADTEESLDMARQAQADGIETIVATPHTLNERYHNPFQKIKAHVASLQEAFLKAQLAVNLHSGADAHICRNMAGMVASGEVGTINGNGKYVLVEFPPQVIPPGFKEELFQLKLKGISAVITHPERNLEFQNHPQALTELVEMGCLLQITALSITGGFGEAAMVCAHQLLKKRMVHVIATDAHSSRGRPPILSPAVEAAAQILGSSEEAEAMVVARPKAIVAGEPVYLPEPQRPQKKKRWFF